MGQVIPFSKIESYLDGLEKQGAPKGTILDTNILISSSYELSDTQESVSELLDILNKKNYRLFATVNTRSEYLEFQRRLVLTESLFDAVDEYSKIKISSRAKAKIQHLKVALKQAPCLIKTSLKFSTNPNLRKLKKSFPQGRILANKAGYNCVMYILKLKLH